MTRDPRKETLDTILADYGPPMLRNVAAYHPAPQRYIDVELPPPAAGLRRSLQQQHQQGAGVAAALGGSLGPNNSSSSVLRAQASTMGQSLRQQGQLQAPAWQETPSEFTSISTGLAPFAGAGPLGNSLRGPAQSALAASSSSLNLGDPTSAWGRSAGLTGGIRDSALVCESTFVYPHGVAPKPGQQQQQQAPGASTATAGDGLAGAGSSATWEELKEQPAPLQAPGDTLDWAVRGAGAAPGALSGPPGVWGGEGSRAAAWCCTGEGQRGCASCVDVLSEQAPADRGPCTVLTAAGCGLLAL